MSEKESDNLTLREMRFDAGLRQVDVAKRLKVDQTAVSNWEIGRRKPRDPIIKELAKLYKRTEEEIRAALAA